MEKIVVIGSSNTDMVIRSARIPVPGETVLGGEFMMADGGKGANQAVAVARLGGEALFIARVGKDMFGEAALQKYRRCGIDTRYVFRDDAPSGVALIMVDEQAENLISVASGANGRLSVADIEAAREDIEQASMVLMQMEIPLPTIVRAAEIAWKAGVRVVLNPAPATRLPEDLYRKLYLLTPNVTEAAILSGIPVTDKKSACQAAEIIGKRGVEIVILTLGSEGAIIYRDGEFVTVAARRVKALDTTAAGDVFNGALCVSLAEGHDIQQAVEFATAASSIAVTRLGAQSSIPTRTEVEAILK